MRRLCARISLPFRGFMHYIRRHAYRVPPASLQRPAHPKTISGSTVLVTGAGGSIGSALTRRIAAHSPQLLLLLDHSEQNLYQIESDLTLNCDTVPLVSVLGDICNEALLSEIFERYRPNFIYHAAAFKHVPLMERNPIAAIQNNVLGTNVLARVARKHGVRVITMVSTDKAVCPRSIMGASKRVAELALVRWTSKENQMNSIRLGNVYGTEGSVVKLFAQQILAGGPVTVTHADATRYFLSLEEAVGLIMLASELPSARILIPDLGKPVRILNLASRMIEEAGFVVDKGIPITFTGLRPGDKMTEDLVSASEFLEATPDPRLSNVKTMGINPDRFDALITNLASAVERRDLFAILETLRCVVPEYEPSEYLLRSREGASA
jgi:FlaA1/EpsC-like NDP-sugar epimerase